MYHDYCLLILFNAFLEYSELAEFWRTMQTLYTHWNFIILILVTLSEYSECPHSEYRLFTYGINVLELNSFASFLAHLNC